MHDEFPTPPGFQGFREEEPVRIYRRNLPHWRQENATYFVTFRLNDSLPAPLLRELKVRREEWERDHPEPRTTEQWEELSQLLTRKQEHWLDQGHGSCLLEVSQHQKILSEAFHHFNATRYELNAYVIMPNHVHLLVRPFDTAGYTLEKILQSWKRHSSREINKARGRTGSIWFEESFDRIVRDSRHLVRCLQYLGRNPGKAGRTAEECPRWVSQQWQASGWDYRGGA